MNFNSRLIFSAFVAALGGLLFGFDTVVISGAQSQLKNLFSLDGFSQGFMTASALVGTFVGSILAGKPGDIWGRRDAQKGSAALYFISAIGCALATSFWMLVAFRFIGGLGIGASSVLAPLYLSEISPAKYRGRFVAFFQFNITFGILVAYFSNYLLGIANLGDAEWRWKLGVIAIPSLIFFLLLFFIPQSPRWLVMKHRKQEAVEVLSEMGTTDAEALVESINHSIHIEKGKTNEPLFRQIYLRPILLAFTIAVFNQLSGINGLLYYLNPIFSMAGFSKISGDLQSMVVGAVLILFTMLGMACIDRMGRITMLLIGSVGTAICMAGVSYIFYTKTHTELLIYLLIGYIGFFAFSQGTVIWVYISEIFPNAVRAKGQVLGSFTHWFMAATVSWLFPVFTRNAGEPGAGIPFAFFAFMGLLQFFVVWRFFPETKGIALEDMEEHVRAAH